MDDLLDYPAAPGNTVSVAYLQGLLDHLGRAGVEVSALLALARLDPALLARRDQRVAASAYLKVLDEGLRRSGDSHLGLHLGEAVRPGYYGVLGYLLMSCATLADALHRQARFATLVGSLGRTELDDAPGDFAEPQVALAWWPQLALPAHLQVQLVEETLAGWVTFGRSITGKHFSPTLVRLRHPAPADLQEHRRLFDCPLHFAQPDNALVFPRRLLDLPLSQADGQVRAMLDAYAERLLKALQRGDSVPDRARELLARQLPEQGADLERLAEQMMLSPRTLQRRLRDSGLSFSQLVDETRRQLVLHYLQDPTLELADIAGLVGFSESGSLLRAFRRWTGLSPSEYRRQQISS